MNIKTIIEAWIIAYNPTSEQIKLAEIRGSFCNQCEEKKPIIGVIICGACGCPIAKKVFTNAYNPCPLKKWKEVDREYFKIKEKKTLI